MNNEKLKTFILPILLVFIAFIAAFSLGSNLVNNVQELLNTKTDYEGKVDILKKKQEKLDQLKKREADEARHLAEEQRKSKPFYKPITTGLDTEAVIAGEFTEVLELIRANKIKVRAIKYDYDPQDDVFVQSSAGSYNVARLHMEMIATYSNYDSFLKELYKHEHFLDIQSVEVVPYRKNKQILLINFKMKLYAKK